MKASDLNMGDVRSVLRVFAKRIGRGFHPDTDFKDYVRRDTGEPSLTPAMAYVWNGYMDACFGACERDGADIYEMANEIVDELFPNAE